MNNISKFQVNKSNDSLEIFNEIKKFIDKYSQQPELSTFFQNFSKLTDCPQNILELKFKKIIYHSFNFHKGNFNCETNKLKIFLSFLKSLVFFFLLFFFGKSKKSQKKYDLIIDDIDDNQEIDRYKNLITKFKNVLVVCNNISVFKYLENIPVSKIISNKQMPNKSFIKGKLLKYLNFFISLLIISLKNKYNLISIFNVMFLSFIKNNTLYSQHHSKFLLQDRVYKLCPIRNYIFKKNGGEITSCTQIHLAEASLCFYIDCDILFTFGNEKYTKKKFLDFGGRIKTFHPIGSYQMESLFFNKKNADINLIDDFDLLVIGINPIGWRHVSDNVLKGFVEYLEWIKKISIKYPNLKIIYKHHTTFEGDPVEENILKDSNITKVVEPRGNLNSYHYLNKSKVAISFGSTMILEGISNKKKCFFIDPNSYASCFYGNLFNLKKVVISDYEKFEEIILQSIKGTKSNNEVNDIDTICLESSRSSERLYNFFSKYKS
ncbi:hypothetical protein OAS47_02815 [Pelagibacteraceae bacterium]|nr:hypothetical protein [Pelagibacteraceae bacterium]